MRPPMQSTPLQQNEVSRHHHHNHQQQQTQQQLHTSTTTITNVVDYNNQQARKAKLQQRDFLVENHLNFACSATAAATAATVATATTAKVAAIKLHPTRNVVAPPTYQQHFLHADIDADSNDGNADDNDDDDSIQLVELSTSPPQHTGELLLRRTPTAAAAAAAANVRIKRASINSSDYHFSRSSSSSDDGSFSSERVPPYLRANHFDDAAEHFVINFPAADSPTHNHNDCISNLPLSETEPLLTNIEATVGVRQRSICLNKNSASLIFTKKDVSPQTTRTAKRHCTTASSASTPTRTTSNNNCSIGVHSNVTAQRRHSLRAANERTATNRKQSKHLPATYHQQQRRSLQLNYNNNLITTSSCSANNNYCCSTGGGGGGVGSGAGAVVLHKHHSVLTSPVAPNTTATVSRKQHAYSWYAPVYSALEEELEHDSRDSSPIHNLANTKKQQLSANRYQYRSSHITSTAADNETVALLETRNQINIQAQLHQQANRDSAALHSRKSAVQAPSSLPLQSAYNATANNIGGGSVDFGSNGVVAAYTNYDAEGPHAGSLGLAGGPLPRRRRIENFLKSLVGLKPSTNGTNGRSNSSDTTAAAAATNLAATAAANATSQLPMPPSPEITITRTPSEQNVVVRRDPAGRAFYKQHSRSSDKLANGGGYVIPGSTASLNVVQQKIWNMLRREGSATSLHQEKSQSIVQYASGMRKCETVLALTRQTSAICSPGIGPNSDAASAFTTGSGIFNANGVEQIRPLNRLRSVTSMKSTCSRCSSLLSLAATGSRYSLNTAPNGSASGFVNTASTQSHMQFQHLQPRQVSQPPKYQRHFSTISTSNVSVCNSRSRDDMLNDSGIGGLSSIAQLPLHQQQQQQQQQQQHKQSSSGNCSRKNSAGANSTHSSSSLSPPPSNLTTATLNSNLTPSSSTPTSPTSTTPTNNAAQAKHDAIGRVPFALPSPSTTFTPPNFARSISQAYANAAVPLSSNVERDAIDGCLANSPDNNNTARPTLKRAVSGAPRPFQIFTCKLCLIDVECASEATTLLQCACHFCTECMRAYVEFEISEGAYEISCPDAQCPAQGVITLPEIANLTTANLMKKHHRYRLNREIELDKSRTWCPRAGCETVCLVGNAATHSDATPSTSTSTTTTNANNATTTTTTTAGDGTAQIALCAVQCPSCKDEFCSACKKTWHPNITCEEHSRRLVADGQDDIGIPFDNDLIKCCPMCAVPIEKDEGCAQMMCKRCKHVFCWYCLASLDDDFLLRHYDKGPCKNKLGHSRASVVWHRAQVIGIFAGFGILLLVASPLLLLAAPCIICCKCRSCSGSKIDEGDNDLDEATALQS